MKEVAFTNNIVAQERLPFPVVLYPGFYGAFFGFKEKTNQEKIFLCSCSKEAINNYLRLRLSKEIPRNQNAHRMFILNSSDFPLELVESLMSKNVGNNVDVVRHIDFENKLCHECNKIVPAYAYCHKMYGGAFKQNYGWYIKKQGYEWGVSNTDIDFEICPQEVLDLLEIKPQEYFQFRRESIDNPSLLISEFENQYRKQERKIWNVLENEVRRKFGHKKIGEAWTSETILFYIVQTLFPDKTVLRHYRPDFLQGLELDIFIKELNLGIEYQGIQHYRPVEHWGGEDAFINLQRRDQQKKERCEINSIGLVYFDYDEELSNEFVFERIKRYKR